MRKDIVLDSGPLALLVQKPGFAEREACQAWFYSYLTQQERFHVPEIVHYELRRELLRLGKRRSLSALDLLVSPSRGNLLVLNSADLRLAADLWAKARQQGKPTADVHALDIDVILCAQVLNAKFASPPIIATTNVKHLSQFVNAREWSTI